MAERSHRLNGGEACIRLWQIFEASLIIVGQDGKKAAGIEFLERGADAYLTSPLNLRELLAEFIPCSAARRQVQQSLKKDN